MADGVDVVDTGSLPMTEPHHAPIFDTGPHPEPLTYPDEMDFLPPGAGPVHIDPSGTVSPELGESIKRWKLALIIAGVWAVGAAAGAGMYYWWFHAMDKTWVEFAALLLVIVSVVAALLIAMIEDRPVLSAVALGVMSTPFAAACGAGLLYGYYAYGLLSP
ncbi:MAG TPA: hypothetical protein PKI77_15975 [Mycobacterium sp.]|nr:hypothetical protein [Mycobacterium sp.]